MNRRRYRIPVGWNHPTARVPFIEQLWSDTLVVPLEEAPGGPYEVARVHGPWSPHIPEKAPNYEVSWGSGSTWRPRRIRVDATQVVRLAQVVVGKLFLIELDARRPQTCTTHKGISHGVLYSKCDTDAWTFCGDDSYIPHDHVEEYWVSEDIPNCPVCKRFKTAWVCFRVFPHEEKRIVVKKADKEALVVKRRAKLPTAFDRILDDDFLEKPRYKPEPVRPPVPEEDPLAVYEVDAREQRLSAARERNLRIKGAKKEMKGR